MTPNGQEVLWDPTVRLLNELAGYLPRLLAMALVLLAGLFLAWAVSALLRRALDLAGFDAASRRLGLTELLQRAGIGVTPTRFISSGAKWVIVLLALLGALSTLNLEIANELVRRSLDFLPNLLVAAVILVIGYLLSDFLADWVTISCVNEGFRLARLAGLAARLLVLFFMVSIALSQLRIGELIIAAAFSILFGGVVFGLALAFALGGQGLAREWLEQAFKRGGASPAAGEEPDTLSHL